MDDSSLPESNSEQEDQSPSMDEISKQVLKVVEEKDPEVFEGIEEFQREQISESFFKHMPGVIGLSISKIHTGPLPAPETLAEYNSIVENGAERIFKGFEDQTKHRISIEKRVIRTQNYQSISGQIMAFVLAVGFGILGTILVLKGHTGAGISVFGFDIVGLATVFITGKVIQRKSLHSSE